jgi:cAMP-binding proteins - catabolite gene activator and regulatory subunit of cAMP-dependent protein kinases
MFQIATYENYPDGTVIFTEGSHGDWIYVVDEGCVEIFRTMNGREIAIARMKEGEIFGEVAYITKGERTASARAIGDTVVGIIDRNFFDREYNQLSDNFRMVLKAMAGRLRAATDALIRYQAEGGSGVGGK